MKYCVNYSANIFRAQTTFRVGTGDTKGKGALSLLPRAFSPNMQNDYNHSLGLPLHHVTQLPFLFCGVNIEDLLSQRLPST